MIRCHSSSTVVNATNRRYPSSASKTGTPAPPLWLPRPITRRTSKSSVKDHRPLPLPSYQGPLTHQGSWTPCHRNFEAAPICPPKRTLWNVLGNILLPPPIRPRPAGQRPPPQALVWITWWHHITATLGTSVSKNPILGISEAYHHPSTTTIEKFFMTIFF